MSLIPFKPFFDNDDLFGDENWVMPVFPKSDITRPAMDIYETDKDIVVELSVPNFDPEKIDISIEEGVLKISGKVEEKKEEKEKGYWKKEIRSGSFERAVKLPSPVKETEINAEYKKGILKVILPKEEPKTSPKVKIKVKE